jgi:hypothetical protein
MVKQHAFNKNVLEHFSGYKLISKLQHSSAQSVFSKNYEFQNRKLSVIIH